MTPSRAAARGWVRAAAALVVVTLIGLFALARYLEPSGQGLGTHQQLGLPPCSFRVMFGIRCPSCGMTTSWAYFVRFQWPESAAVNVGGFLLAVLAAVTVALAARLIRTGRVPKASTQRVYTAVCLAIIGVALVEWLARIS